MRETRAVGSGEISFSQSRSRRRTIEARRLRLARAITSESREVKLCLVGVGIASHSTPRNSRKDYFLGRNRIYGPISPLEMNTQAHFWGSLGFKPPSYPRSRAPPPNPGPRPIRVTDPADVDVDDGGRVGRGLRGGTAGGPAPRPRRGHRPSGPSPARSPTPGRRDRAPRGGWRRTRRPAAPDLRRP